MIRHILASPDKKRFMASFSALGSSSNGNAVADYDQALEQLDEFVGGFIKKMEELNYKYGRS